MRLYYTSRILTEQFRWNEPVLPEDGSLYPVYHGPLAERITSFHEGRKGLFLGLMERRADGIYFIPDTSKIGGTKVRRFSTKNNDNLAGGDASKDARKLKTGREVLEVFDVQGNHLATMRVTGE